jgi:5-oxoprolinase (ATP-hydrolysing)
LGGRKDFAVQKGDCFVIDTPGGGGWGTKDEAKADTDELESAKRSAVERRFVSQFQLAQEASN